MAAPDGGDRMKRLRGRVGRRCLCLCAVMLAGSGVSASPALAQFRVESQAVLVDVAVSDGGPVLDLREEDFELYEGGEATSFRLLDPASLPVAVVFAMDVSASTVGERQRRLGRGGRALRRRSDPARFVRGDRILDGTLLDSRVRTLRRRCPDRRADDRARRPDLGSGQRDPLPRGAPSGRRPESAPVVHRRVRQPELVIGRPGDDGRTGFRRAHLFHRRASARFLSIPGAERRRISLDSGGLRGERWPSAGGVLG